MVGLLTRKTLSVILSAERKQMILDLVHIVTTLSAFYKASCTEN